MALQAYCSVSKQATAFRIGTFGKNFLGRKKQFLVVHVISLIGPAFHARNYAKEERL
jgi:hypothetical protein